MSQSFKALPVVTQALRFVVCSEHSVTTIKYKYFYRFNDEHGIARYSCFFIYFVAFSYDLRQLEVICYHFVF